METATLSLWTSTAVEWITVLMGDWFVSCLSMEPIHAALLKLVDRRRFWPGPSTSQNGIKHPFTLNAEPGGPGIMKIMRFYCFLSFILAVSAAPLSAQTPEQVVTSYFEKMKTGGINTVATLMHPDELRKFREMLTPVIEGALA